ncbi:MAG: hypothetical protein RIE53_04495 [Rhodothermales bacterium]
MTRSDNHQPAPKMCRDSDAIHPLLTEVALGTAGAATEQRVREHVTACPTCAKELDARRELLARVVPDRSEPPAAFFDDFADSVMARIASDSTPRPRLRTLPTLQSPTPSRSHRRPQPGTFTPRVLAWSFRAAAAIVLIVSGIFIGRAGQPGVPSADVAPGPPTGPDPTVASAMDVLDRSRTLLLDIMNTEQAPNMDLRQRAAGELAVQAAEIHGRLDAGEQARLAALLQELELVLLQMAHARPESGSQDVAMIREGVDRNGLLFKIELTAL